jgi:hypothetical protein
VLGPPGSGGDLIAAALARAGFDDVSAATRDENDEWLAARRASRLAPPPAGEAGQRAPAHASRMGDDGDTVSFDPATALAFGAPAPGARGPELVVIVWAPPAWTLEALAPAGVAAATATALWDRYQRAALIAPTGHPAVVVDGSALRGDAARAAEQLEPIGEMLGVTPELRSALDAWPATPTASPVAPQLDVPLTSAAPSFGPHREWQPPALDAAPGWCDALLDAAWRAHRSQLEATEAWRALAAARVTPRGDAVEHRLELWRARDDAIGREAELVAARAQCAAAEARGAEAMRLTDELRRELTETRDERDRMATSLQWRVGRSLVGPLQRIRRALRGSA